MDDPAPRPDWRQSRLQQAFAASLALHALAGWLVFPAWQAMPVARVAPAALSVRLDARPAAALPSVPAAKVAHASAATGLSAEAAAAGSITRPRFLSPPDIDGLRTIPVPAAGSLSLRLYVTAAGTVERVEVRRSDPVPPELLEGIRRRFRQAALQPAMSAAGPLPGTLDIEVRFEPAGEESE